MCRVSFPPYGVETLPIRDRGGAWGYDLQAGIIIASDPLPPKALTS